MTKTAIAAATATYDEAHSALKAARIAERRAALASDTARSAALVADVAHIAAARKVETARKAAAAAYASLCEASPTGSSARAV